jgi:HK97 family phage prohead protease
MSSVITRVAQLADLELRGDGRTVVGVAVPFDSPTVVHEYGQRYRETFRHGAFTRTLAERGPQRVKLLALHQADRLPLGRLTAAREDAAGLVIEGRVSQTAAGDEVLELVRDGALDAFSVGFRPVRDRWSPSRDAVERLEVALLEVSLVPFPAYADAVVTAVRQEPLRTPAHLDPSTWATRFATAYPASPSAWAARLGLTRP